MKDKVVLTSIDHGAYAGLLIDMGLSKGINPSWLIKPRVLLKILSNTRNTMTIESFKTIEGKVMSKCFRCGLEDCSLRGCVDKTEAYDSAKKTQNLQAAIASGTLKVAISIQDAIDLLPPVLCEDQTILVVNPNTFES